MVPAKWLVTATDYISDAYNRHASRLDLYLDEEGITTSVVLKYLKFGRHQIVMLRNRILRISSIPADSRYTDKFKKSVNFFVSKLEDHYDIVCDIIIGRTIGSDPHKTPSPLIADPRWVELEEFAKRNGGEGVAVFGQQLFSEPMPQAPDPELPQVAPATWKADKQLGEAPPAFVKRVYGEWLGKGFTRATVRHLDPPLAQAITNWLRQNVWPPDVDLPTAKEHNSRWIDRVSREGLSAVPGGDLKEASRLAEVQRHRDRRSGP